MIGANPAWAWFSEPVSSRIYFKLKHKTYKYGLRARGDAIYLCCSWITENLGTVRALNTLFCDPHCHILYKDIINRTTHLLCIHRPQGSPLSQRR